MTAVLLGLSLLAMPIGPDYPRPPWWPHDQPAIYPSAYSWKAADGSLAEGTVNCDSDCSHTALTHVGDELFGRAIACPVSWLGYISTSVLSVSWDGGATWIDYWCIDTFGTAVNQRLTEVDGIAVYRIDFAVHPPATFPYHGEYNWNWRRRWEKMAEFEVLREQWKAAMVATN